MSERKPLYDVAFRVPNNQTGNKFIANCRKYVNREKYSRVVTRPRNGTQMHYSHDTEREGCKSFAVYLSHSPRQIRETYDIQDKNYIHRNKYEEDMRKMDHVHDDDVNALKSEIRTWQDTAAELNETLIVTQKQRLVWLCVATFLAAYSLLYTIATYVWYQ